jgi:cyclic pyranopterin phosphate synthase
MGLSHFDESGQIKMVDISEKDATKRRAVARGRVILSKETVKTIRDGATPKGNPFEIARIAGIMAAKKTSELIPLCHQVSLSSVKVELELGDDFVDIVAEAVTISGTGVEMEALTAVSAAALTIYDMCKAVQKDIRIDGIELVEKTGGKSDYRK